MSRVALVLVFFVIALGTMSSAQTVTLVLQEDVSSKLPTGTKFTARDSAGKTYRGHVVTHPARRFLRRGSMSLVFDDPVLPVTKDPEGVFRAGNRMRLLKLGGSLAAAKLADDAVDGAIGATKARYVGLAAGAALMVLQKGGEAKLHKGRLRFHRDHGQTLEAAGAGDIAETEAEGARAHILSTRTRQDGSRHRTVLG